ncbi:MAG: helix-turn-helix transcriptional regulator [Clostridia bacterium]|nr:helix-turn-helix transcriptional regulator [Clostridia bacterium]
MKKFEKKIMSRFEKEVRKALIDKDMSLGDLASEMQITLSYLYDIFNGNRPGDIQKEKIVAFLGLDRSILAKGA